MKYDESVGMGGRLVEVRSRNLGQPVRPAGRLRRLRWVSYVAVALVGIILVAGLGAYGWARRSLPQTTGELTLEGLQSPVSVYRDKWGVPHIEATNNHDLFMAQGFTTAQDRLWQMDVSRRAAAGRLSEVFGEGRVESDRFLRALFMRPAAEKSWVAYSPWAKEILEAYAQGVNAYIKQAVAAGRLPVEFTLVGYKPDPWTPVDSISIGKFMAYDLGGNYSAEVYRYQLRQVLGDELTRQLLPMYPSDGVTIMQTAESGESQPRTAHLPPDDSHVDVSGLLANGLFPDEFLGSNNWVVSGKLTRTGKPILANDPHLGMSTPAIWYQTHLVLNSPNEKMNAIGVMFPGAPGLVIGHTDQIAWGVTNTGPDVQDLYIEKRNPQNPYQFEFMGKWEDATVYKDPIKVKGKPDVPNEVVVTRHGPIVSDVVGSKDNRPKEALALKWTAHMATTEMEAVLSFDKAANWSDFREALRKFSVPTQNFVFASRDGTIAYRAGGIVPIRAKGDGLVPVPGWTGEYEWKDFIPFQSMPEVVNPPAGFIVTANNKVVGDAYPFFLTYSWAQPHRATRITEVLKSKTGLTVDDMRLLQIDNVDLQARTLLPLLLPVLERASLGAAEKGALALLKGWDYADDADKGAPLVYHTWWKRLTQQLYELKMGPDLYGRMADKGLVTEELLKQAAKGNPGDWVKNAGGLDQLATDSFKAAVADVSGLQGSNPQKWNWGKFHQVGPHHTIGDAVKPLGWFLNPTMYPVGGSNVTVQAMSFNAATGQVTSGPVWRQVVDMADVAGNSFDIVEPGQSGNFLSRWYQDQLPLHVKGELHPQLLTPNQYGTGERLTLKP